jgi:hypothetical protein
MASGDESSVESQVSGLPSDSKASGRKQQNISTRQSKERSREVALANELRPRRSSRTQSTSLTTRRALSDKEYNPNDDDATGESSSSEEEQSLYPEENFEPDDVPALHYDCDGILASIKVNKLHKLSLSFQLSNSGTGDETAFNGNVQVSDCSGCTYYDIIVLENLVNTRSHYL